MVPTRPQHRHRWGPVRGDPYHGGMSTRRRTGTPGVGVVIPAFNEDVLVRRCLEAVLDQTVPARQIIVVDNASTDATRAVVSRLQAEHPEAPLLLSSPSPTTGRPNSAMTSLAQTCTSNCANQPRQNDCYLSPTAFPTMWPDLCSRAAFDVAKRSPLCFCRHR